MKMRFLFFSGLVLLIMGSYNTISGQHFQTIKQAEDSLATIIASINLAADDSSKDAFNQVFIKTLSEALKLSESDRYQFESLKTLVKITSPDNKFRIYHWNLPTVDGKHRYYGFIKVFGKDSPFVYPLVDATDSLPSPDTLTLDNLRWPGALYYMVIPETLASGQKIYTLLGWAGKNTTITQKIIEILVFDDHDRPHFGYKLFPDYMGGNMSRIIFRFAANTTMSMKYETQTISTNKKWNIKKRDFDLSKDETEMIVFDRMVPLDPLLEGQYQFYVAAGDISDGFIFKNNTWSFMRGIEARNKK